MLKRSVLGLLVVACAALAPGCAGSEWQPASNNPEGCSSAPPSGPCDTAIDHCAYLHEPPLTIGGLLECVCASNDGGVQRAWHCWTPL
jgi:hypothetical protein